MINRRIAIFALVGVLVFSAVALKNKFVTDDFSGIEDDIEIVTSDQEDVEIVEDDGMRRTVLYFKDGNDYIVPVMRKIPWQEGIGKTALSNMVDSAELRQSLEGTGLLPIIPSGTEIYGMTIDQDAGVCKIDFSKEVLNAETKEDEENLIKGVVYTLTEFPAIKEVKFTVEGQEVDAMTNGTNVASNLTRDNINYLGEVAEASSDVVVYYKGEGNSDFEYFIPVTVPTMAPVTNVFTALDVLFEGPPEGSGLASAIPSDAQFHGVEIKDGTAYVDVTLGAESMLTIDAVMDDLVQNIGLTLSEFDEIETVEVLVGEEAVNTEVPVFANEY